MITKKMKRESDEKIIKEILDDLKNKHHTQKQNEIRDLQERLDKLKNGEELYVKNA